MQTTVINVPNQQMYAPTFPPNCDDSVTNRRSSLMIMLGCIQLIFTTILFGWCIWTVAVDPAMAVSYLGFFSSVCHIAVGIFAIISGKDVKNRPVVITTIVLGIIAASVFGLLTLAISALSVPYQKGFCQVVCSKKTDNHYQYGYEYDFAQRHKPCPSYCSIAPSLMYWPISIFSLIQAVVDIVVSSVACSYVCQCCGKILNTTQGVVLSPPPGNLRANNTFQMVPCSNDTLNRPGLKTQTPGDDFPPSYTQSYPQTTQPFNV